jgi:lipopolysaccharide transport system permease protein
MLTTDPALTVITPPTRWAPINLMEVWEYRELLRMFWWRDVRQRYARPAISLAWAALQPMFTLGLFSIVFGYFLNQRGIGGSYAASTACSLFIWQLFSGAGQNAATSIVSNDYLIRSCYFPRLCLPLSRVIGRLFDSLISLPLFFVVFLMQGVSPAWSWLLVPALVIWALALALGVGLVLDAIVGVKRMLRHIVPFGFSAGLLMSPVAYSTSVINPQWETLYSLNPVVGLIEAFRWAILGHSAVTSLQVTISLGWATVLLTGGLFLHRALDQRFTSEMNE